MTAPSVVGESRAEGEPGVVAGRSSPVSNESGGGGLGVETLALLDGRVREMASPTRRIGLMSDMDARRKRGLDVSEGGNEGEPTPSVVESSSVLLDRPGL